MASWYSESLRMQKRIKGLRDTVAYGKISGAVGTFAHLNPKTEEYVCRKLGLKPEPVSTQIVPRDRHAEYLCELALVAASLEKFAVEVRHLQRTEVREAEEPFTKGQKGSSAMPHKRNPILSENICGLARLIRGFAMTGLDNVALWHERDISHSSAERVILPDASIALDFMIARMNHLLSGLQVYPENMKKNLALSHDVIFSGTLLLALVDKGLTREESYALVQRAAFSARERGIRFEDAVKEDPEIEGLLTPAELAASLDVKAHFSNIPYIIKRAFKTAK
jgi:adenylosuccinate lyase